MIKSYRKFVKRSETSRRRAESIYLWPTNRPDWEFKYLSASLLSDIWQTWCDFCRSVILKSCIGSKTKSGISVPPRPGLNSWGRIAYEATQAFKGRPIRPAGTTTFRRHEPTWGDQSLLIRAIPVLSPANRNSLIAGFGLPFSAPRHIQAIRNACAHLNSESMNEIRRLMIYYNGTNLSHPIDIMWWLDPLSRTDAVFTWIDELEIIADHVTS